MNICLIAQMLAALANANHTAQISAVQMIQAAQFAEAQCNAEKKAAEEKVAIEKPKK